MQTGWFIAEVTGLIFVLKKHFCVILRHFTKQTAAGSGASKTTSLSKLCRGGLVDNSHLFPEEVQENCLCVVTSMKQCAHMYLLGPVHKALKVSLIITELILCFLPTNRKKQQLMYLTGILPDVLYFCVTLLPKTHTVVYLNDLAVLKLIIYV